MKLNKPCGFGLALLGALFLTSTPARASNLWNGTASLKMAHMVALRSADGGVVRITLVDSLESPGAGASIRRLASSNGSFVVAIKRSALSSDVLSAVFSLFPHMEVQQGRHPHSNIVIYVPQATANRPLNAADRQRFEMMSEELRAKIRGQFLEVPLNREQTRGPR